MSIQAAIATNRFGLGARPGEIESVGSQPAGWLLDQLEGPPATPAPVAALPGCAETLVKVQKLRLAQRDRQNSAADGPQPDEIMEYARTVRSLHIEQVFARYRTAVESEHPFHERLVHFWANHFAVSAAKQPVSAIAGLYENGAIRPNVAGRFEDLLIAAVAHPAMITNLDNQRSIGPTSRRGKAAARRSGNRTIGLNENLAREVLELHTLGVSGGYDQADVESFAKVLTGWSIGLPDSGSAGEFTFYERVHEPGPQVVMGKRYDDEGMDQGLAVLRDLAAHPATASFIATKLATHFVADEPPADLVKTLETRFVETGGDLAEVYEALVDSPLAWQPTQQKLKTPHEFIVSAIRSVDVSPRNGRFLTGALDLLGQPAYRPPSPAGWPDNAAHWGGADALYKRIESSSTVSGPASRRNNPIDVAENALGDLLSAETRTALARAESAEQAMTLFLMSPDFQRR